LPRIDTGTYFNNTRPGYDELKDWTPTYYQGIKEADANLRFAGQTIDQMADSLEAWCRNMFTDTMDEDMLSRMEDFYKLDSTGLTLEERRRLLNATRMGSGRISTYKLSDMIKAYTGTDSEVTFLHRVDIKLISDGSPIDVSKVQGIIERRLPAHLAYRVGVTADTHIRIKTGTGRYKIHHTMSGTIPKTSSGYVLVGNGVEITPEGKGNKIESMPASDDLAAGTIPKTSSAVSVGNEGVIPEVETVSYGIQYKMCGDTFDI
jgi:hypothetical protein